MPAVYINTTLEHVQPGTIFSVLGKHYALTNEHLKNNRLSTTTRVATSLVTGERMLFRSKAQVRVG